MSATRTIASSTGRAIAIGLSLGVLLALVWAAVAIAQERSFPTLTGRVVDTAQLLPANEEASLIAKLAAHETKSGQQLVVATIPSLNGEQIEDYANRLFRHWGLGDKERNDGVLFLVAKNDRKLRIEVGYGLEGTLTDALSAYIIRQTVVPAFKRGDFAGGISSGADQILNVLTSDEAELESWQTRSKNRKSSNRDNNDDPAWPAVLFIVVWMFFMFGFPLMHYLIKKFGKKIGPDRYRWLGIELNTNKRERRHNSGWTGGGWSGGGGGGGGFGGGGGSSGGGGASGGW